MGLVNDTSRWNTAAVRKKLNAAVPNATFNAQSALEFETTTVQGAFIAFAAMGDTAYFNDPRASEFTINIHDIHTVHFLEPLSGKGGLTPNFDAVTSMLHAGTAYTLATSPSGVAWLEESAALTALCPPKPTPARLACLTRVDSTIKVFNSYSKSPLLSASLLRYHDKLRKQGGGSPIVGPSVAILRANDLTSMAEVRSSFPESHTAAPSLVRRAKPTSVNRCRRSWRTRSAACRPSSRGSRAQATTTPCPPSWPSTAGTGACTW